MSQPTIRVASLTGQAFPATCLDLERLLAIPGLVRNTEAALQGVANGFGNRRIKRD